MSDTDEVLRNRLSVRVWLGSNACGCTGRVLICRTKRANIECCFRRSCSTGLHACFAGGRASFSQPVSWKVGRAVFLSKDFTQGCTIEAHNFQRDEAQYVAKNAVILGVSLDSSESHKQFCAKEGLNFKLLADEQATVASQYGSLAEFEGKPYAARNTFIIDPNGVVKRIYRGVKPNGHSEEVLGALAELQKSKV